MQKIILMTKSQGAAVCGGLTQTSKMPCKSSSLPTEACMRGFELAQQPGTICAACYANKGFYRAYENNIKPAQFARLDAVWLAMQDDEQAALWVSGMAAMIGADQYFRHHDSGDLQGLRHLELIAELAQATPNCRHWLPTREYEIVAQYISKHGALPDNLIVRLSAIVPDVPVKMPSALRDVKNVTASNVHATGAVHGLRCAAPDNAGACGDCRACWSDQVVSYGLH